MFFSSPNTLTNKSTKVKSGVKGDANLLRPTLMCAVPMILERIYKSIVDTARRQGWAVEELFHYFVNYKMKWQVSDWFYQIISIICIEWIIQEYDYWWNLKKCKN